MVEEIAKAGLHSFACAEVAPRDPGHGLDVAKPARACLDVGLQAVARVPVAEMPPPLLLLLGAKELAGPPHPGRRDRFPHLLEQRPRAGEMARLHQIGDHGEVAAGFLGALPDAADRVADFDPEVPGKGDEGLDTGVRAPPPERRCPPRAHEHQQVDVRAGVQLAPPVPPHRDQGCVVFASVGPHAAGAAPGGPQRVVHRGRAAGHDLTGRGAGLEARPQLLAAALEGGSQPGGPWRRSTWTAVDQGQSPSAIVPRSVGSPAGGTPPCSGDPTLGAAPVAMPSSSPVAASLDAAGSLTRRRRRSVRAAVRPDCRPSG